MAVYVESKSSKLNIEVITVDAGTAAYPAIVASGDSDTGCFFPDANTFAVSTAGVQRFRIDSTGRIGTNQLSNFHNLYVNRSATGNTTQIGVGSECVILSDVTSQFVGFRTNPATSGSFNLTNIHHYQAAQFSALGVGSSVTNIYGFNATASLGGKATNTYGFYSDIASASNTWNLYVNGTAPSLFNGVVYFASGTAALPSITNSTDTNTGLFWPAADTVAISTAGLERVRVDSSGRAFFYGTSSADGHTAYVDAAPATARALAIRGRSSDNASGLWFTTSTNTLMNRLTSTNAGLDIQSSSSGYIRLDTASILSFLTSGTERLRMNSSGFIGIGISAPSSRLDVNGVITVSAGSAASPAIVVSGDSNTGIAQIGGADTWSVVTDGTERIRVEANGDIRIGSSTAIGRVELCSPASSKGTAAAPETSGIIAFPNYNHTRDLCTIQSIAREANYTAGQLAVTCANASGNSNTYFVIDGQSDSVKINTGNTTRMTVRSDGNSSLGGEGASNVGLYLQQTLASTSSRFGIYSQPTLSANSTSVAYLVNSGAILEDNSAPTTIVGYHVSNASLGTNASVGIQYGYLVPSNFTAGSTNIGFRSAIPDGENRWNIWNDGTAPNYFAGKVLIGAQNASDYNSYSDDLVVHSGGAQSGMTIRGTQYNTIAFADGTGSSNNLRGWVQYLHDDDSLRLGAGGGARIYITSIGRVGISNNNPAYILDVNGTINTSAGIIVTTGTANSPSYTFNGDSNTGLFAPSADNLAITTGGTERLRVDSSGKILVGTTTSRSAGPAVHPAFQFEGTNAGAASFQCIAGSGQATVSPQILLARHRGGIGDSTLVQDGDTIGIIRFNGGDGTDCVSNAAQIECRIEGTPGSNDMPGRLMFSTTSDGSATATERMRIKSNGVVRFIPLSADPASAEEGDMYFNSTSKKLKVYDGTSWVDLH